MNNYQKTDFKNKVPQSTTKSKGRDMPNNFVKNTKQMELFKLWEWQGLHYTKYFLKQKGNIRNIHTIQEEEAIGNVENKMCMINAALEN